MENIPIGIEFQADYNKLAQNIDKEISKLESRLGSINVGFNVDSKSIDSSIKSLEKKLSGLDANLNIEADSKTATKEISKLESEIKKLSDKNIKLDADVSSAKKEIESLQKQIEDSGSGFGTALVGGLAGGGIALGLDAITSQVGDAISGVIEFSKEISSVKRNIEATTNLQGQELDDFAARIKATAETFDEDTEEIFKSAQKLAAQTGEDINVVFDNIQAGFINGANASGELTAVTQEYGSVIKEAGGNSATLVSLLKQSEDAGIFSDKGIDVVKEFGLRIRELPKGTRDAIDGLGLNSDQIAKDLESGAKSQLDIMKEVSEALSKVPANSAAAGVAVADIFGGPGEDAGLKFLTNLQNINTEQNNLTDNLTKSQKAQQDSLRANEELNKVLTELFSNIAPLINQVQTALTELFTDTLRAGVNGFTTLKDVAGELAPILAAMSAAFAAANARLIANTVITKSKLVLDKAMIGFTKAWTLAQKALNLVLNANPLGKIILAVGLLTTGLKFAYENSETFREIVDGLWESFKDLLKPLGFVKDAIISLLESLGILEKETKIAPVNLDNLEKDRKLIEDKVEDIDNSKKKLGEPAPPPPALNLVEMDKSIDKAKKTTEDLRNKINSFIQGANNNTDKIVLNLDRQNVLNQFDENIDDIEQRIENTEIDKFNIAIGAKLENANTDQNIINEFFEQEIQDAEKIFSAREDILIQQELKELQILENSREDKLRAKEKEYNELLEQAEKHGIDTKNIEEARNKEIDAINSKFDADATSKIEANNEKFTELNKDKARTQKELNDQRLEETRKLNKQIEILTEQEVVNRLGATNELIGSVGDLAEALGASTTVMKGFSIAQATINTYLAATAALKLPFPINFVQTAAVIATGLAQIAKIRGAEEGVIGLTDSYSKTPGKTDTIPFMLAKGESVMTASETQKYKPYLEAMRNGTFTNMVRPEYTSFNDTSLVNELRTIRMENRELRGAISRQKTQFIDKATHKHKIELDLRTDLGRF